MNNDLISRDALKKHITEIFEIEEKYDKKWAMGLKYSLKIIDNAPTVEERPQGKWQKVGKYACECSICGESVCGDFMNFCPNCGAYMKKGGDNE